MKHFARAFLLLILIFASGVAMAAGGPLSQGGDFNGNGAAVSGSGTSTTNPVSSATAEYPLTDGSGTTVTDISGNNNNGTFCTVGHTPTWTTYGLNFVSRGQCVSLPVTTFKTALLHICTLNLSAPTGFIAPLAPPSGSSSGINFATFPINGSVLNGVSAITPTVWSVGGSSAVTAVLASAIPPQNCGVVALTLDTLDHAFFNGVEYAYNNQSTSASVVGLSAGSYYLGGQGTTTTWSYQGTIDYAVFYSTALTSSQIVQESSYINGKVNSRLGVPVLSATATGITPNNTFTCIGDSLTVGLNGSAWCNSTYLTPTNLTYTFNINAISGRYAHDIAASLQSGISSLLSATGGRNKCLVWAGTNDGVGGAFSAAQAWAALSNIGTQLKQMGCQPIIQTMISRTGGDTFKNSLNALIRANYLSFYAAMSDLAAIPSLGADGANTNPNSGGGITCFGGDNVHLMNTGSCYNSLSSYPVVGWLAARLTNVMDGATVSNPTVTTSNAYTQLIADNYVLQTPSAGATDVLPDCTGLTGIQRTITNGSGSFAITVSSGGSLSITGSTNIAANATATYTCELTGATTGGNYWLRTQ